MTMTTLFLWGRLETLLLYLNYIWWCADCTDCTDQHICVIYEMELSECLQIIAYSCHAEMIYFQDKMHSSMFTIHYNTLYPCLHLFSHFLLFEQVVPMHTFCAGTFQPHQQCFFV